MALCLAESVSSIAAQQLAGLELELYAGLSITGAVGTVYSVEFVADLSQTNAWRTLEFVQLRDASQSWTDRTAPAKTRRFYRAVPLAPPDMVFIPPGSFRMGSPTNEVGRSDDEGPQTVVTLTQGFYMGQYKVTQKDYEWVTGLSPSAFPGDDNRPVETVSWEDATNYCALVTQRDRAAKLIPPGSAYRLPTEAEWEYACRAWTSTRYSFGDDPDYSRLADYAWFKANSANITHAVGQKLPNPWGLFDMHGGLWEWVQDWYGPYPGGRLTNPTGPATGSYRAFRGGSWGCDPWECRSAARDFNPEGETGYVGFRVVLAPSE